jgi:hypothetical protein
VLSILLSYSSRDRFFVRKLGEQLLGYGVNVCLDVAEVSIGDLALDRIAEELCVTDSVGVVLSHNSVSSDWVRKELRAGLAKEQARRQLEVFPILEEPVELPDFLQKLTRFDFTDAEKTAAAFPQLLKALGVAESAPRPNNAGHEATPNTDREPSGAKPASGPTASAAAVPATPTVRRLTDFRDIRIVRLDAEHSTRLAAGTPIYNFRFELSEQPPTEWLDAFAAELQFSSNTAWRKCWIEEGGFFVQCSPEVMDDTHLAWLRNDVAGANHRYRRYLNEIVEREVGRLTGESRELQFISDLGARLKFD